MIILGTNVSEVLRPSPSAKVLGWLAAQEPDTVFTTTITEAEVLFGIEILPAGKRRAGRSTSQSDAMIVAIVKSHGALAATRNTSDFEHCGVRVVDPWAA